MSRRRVPLDELTRRVLAVIAAEPGQASRVIAWQAHARKQDVLRLLHDLESDGALRRELRRGRSYAWFPKAPTAAHVSRGSAHVDRRAA